MNMQRTNAKHNEDYGSMNCYARKVSKAVNGDILPGVNVPTAVAGSWTNIWSMYKSHPKIYSLNVRKPINETNNPRMAPDALTFVFI
jgi:hypothetical protein